MDSGQIRQLLEAHVFPHSVESLELIETHISWVILTGDFAYKIKKPVDLGFVDFTSLAQRKHYCEEELRLNRRTAPELYLDVVSIAAAAEGLRIGHEPAIEYAVKMRQFPGDARLDRQLEAGLMDRTDMLGIAETVAKFHQSLAPGGDIDPTGEFTRIRQFALDNFGPIRSSSINHGAHAVLAQVETWTRFQLGHLRQAIEHRARSGYVRDGHGDLHLANLVRLGQRIVAFDCLEFNPDLRCVDVMNDMGFLVMDLMAHERADLAFDFLNAYLEQTGDYPGIAVLRFYLVYRCMVRAKVAALQPHNGGAGSTMPGGNAMRRYLERASSLQAPGHTPRLYLMHGLSGSGKSWLSDRLIGPLGAIRVSSDLERKRLHGLALQADSHSGIGRGLYVPEATAATYDALEHYCETGLQTGFDMIADASFLDSRQRERFVRLADRLSAGLVIIDCTAPLDVLRERIRIRSADPHRVSEAGLEVLDHQLGRRDPLTDEEQRLAVQVPMNEAVDFPRLAKRLATH